MSYSVVPVFMKFVKLSDPSDYRPIFPLPLFGKVFKALINAEVFKLFTSHDCFSNLFFRFARSTAYAYGLRPSANLYIKL